MNLFLTFVNLLVLLGNQLLALPLLTPIGFEAECSQQQCVEQICPPRSIPGRQNREKERGFDWILTVVRDDTQMERVSAFGQVGVFLDASTRIRTPFALGCPPTGIEQAVPLLFEPITVEYRLGRVIIADTVLDAQGVVAPTDVARRLAAVIERVGTIADIDAANVGGEGFERFEGIGRASFKSFIRGGGGF